MRVGARPHGQEQEVIECESWLARGLCHLKGWREISTQDRQIFSVFKAHFRGLGRMKLSCEIPYLAPYLAPCREPEASCVPLQRRHLLGVWISAPEGHCHNSAPLSCAALSLCTCRWKHLNSLYALLSLFLVQTYVHLHALLSCILLTAPALSPTHML